MTSNPKITSFLTFAGNAEDAMNFYVSAFSGKIISITHVPKDGHGDEGKVLHGAFEIFGQQFMAMDMQQEYAVPFSWATSFYIDCATEAEFDLIFETFSDGGSVMMGPEPVLEMRKVAWVTDKYGVTWQPVWK
ncbi:hypothetical protein MsAg5_13710 [Methanosarcinaceae archaeon Ag5]|uniref:PhnB-like domain-containing protein n=1 Tax=Methanolapillus africanus TaxID=3028297 RepID=A0AAE4SDK2_9EURY|nr:hypothetical protein [Methanosarcinaceae archaeon Ag5]